MKKIIMAVAAIAMAASMFAADFAATLNVSGNAAAQDAGGAVRILETDDTNFSSGKDLFAVNFSGDKAGASLGIGTVSAIKIKNEGGLLSFHNSWEQPPEDITVNYGGSNGNLKILSAKLWFQPIDQITITWGNLSGEKLYCEHINWWRTPENKGALDEYTGLNFDIKPIDALRISISLNTGWGGSWITINEFKYQDYSVLVKYNFGGFDVGVAFHDGGLDKGKVLNVGGSFGNEWGGPFYGFVNVYLMSGTGWNFNEVAIDNWFKFKLDSVTASVRLPVAIMFDMSSILMDWEIKVEAPVNALNLYGRIGTYGAVWKESPTVSWGAPYNLKDFKFNMGARLGATFNVGACALDACFALGLQDNDGIKVDWKIPVGAKVSF